MNITILINMKIKTPRQKLLIGLFVYTNKMEIITAIWRELCKQKKTKATSRKKLVSHHYFSNNPMRHAVFILIFFHENFKTITV